MVRVSKKNENGGVSELNPEAEERKRRKKLAFSKNLLSDTPSKAFSALSPSKTVIKHHGKDILKKSQRKNRFLFSFPGLLAPIAGGKIGELKDLGTKNPILYLDFPQGQMKLFGTIVYPKNRYLTLHFSRGGKNVMCEDYFDNMIVFSDAWWIGRKEENPEEARLEFPKELSEGQSVEYDFKGGAGMASDSKQGVSKPEMKYVELQSPKPELEDDLSGEDSLKEVVEMTPKDVEVTPVRHSQRTAGKTFNFAEASSGDDSVENDGNISDGQENSGSATPESGDEDAEARTRATTQIQESAGAATKSRKRLSQATISTLFKKVEEQKTSRTPRKSSSAKASAQKTDSRKAQEQGKKRKVIEETKSEIDISTESEQSDEEKKTSRTPRKSSSTKVSARKTDARKAQGPRKRRKVIEETKSEIDIPTESEQSDNPTSDASVRVYKRKMKSPAA